MNTNQLLKELIAKSSVTKASIARWLGMSAQAFESRLSNASEPKVNFLIAVLDRLDMGLVIVPKSAIVNGKLPNGSVVLDSGFEFESVPQRAPKVHGNV